MMLPVASDVKRHQVRLPLPGDIIKAMSTLGQRLKEAMALRGVSSNEVDRSCGFVAKDKDGRPKLYSAGYTSRLANDKRKNPEAEKIEKIAAFLRVNFLWLFRGQGPRDLPDGPPPPDGNPTALEAMLGQSLIDANDNVEVVIAYLRGQVSREAIAAFRRRQPSRELSTDELRMMLLEIQRDLTQDVIRRANEERSAAGKREADEARARAAAAHDARARRPRRVN